MINSLRRSTMPQKIKITLGILLPIASLYGMQQGPRQNSVVPVTSLQKIALNKSIDYLRSLKSGQQFPINVATILNGGNLPNRDILLKELIRDTALLQGIIPFYGTVKSSPDKTKWLVEEGGAPGNCFTTLHQYNPRTLKSELLHPLISDSFIINFEWSPCSRYMSVCHAWDPAETLLFWVIDLQGHEEHPLIVDAKDHTFAINHPHIIARRDNKVIVYDYLKKRINNKIVLPTSLKDLKKLNKDDDLLGVQGNEEQYIIKLPENSSHQPVVFRFPKDQTFIANFDGSFLITNSNNTLAAYDLSKREKTTYEHDLSDLHTLRASSTDNRILLNEQAVWDIELNQIIYEKKHTNNQVFKFNKALDKIYSLTKLATHSIFRIQTLDERVVKEQVFNEPFEKIEISETEDFALLQADLHKRAVVINLANDSHVGVATAGSYCNNATFIDSETISVRDNRNCDLYLWKLNTLNSDVTEQANLSEILAYFILRNNQIKKSAECPVAKKIVQMSQNCKLKKLLQMLENKKAPSA